MMLVLALMILAFPVLSAAAEPLRARWEYVTIEGGAELLTLFAVVPAPPGSESEEVPLLSVLRDTLGDFNPDNDRLRYVWLLAGEKRGAPRRWLTPGPRPGKVPRPTVDLAAPAKGVWKGVLRAMLQTMMLDPSGARVRIPSRSYFSSEAASRTVRLFEAVALMARLEEDGHFGALTAEEYSRVLARVLLAERALGGLVRDTHLHRILHRELAARRQALGRNWELLRQRAEAEGLYFQPMAVGDGQPTAALLWVARADLDKPRRRPFRSQFLGIADPWRDPQLREWNGYSETWHFDSEGRRTAAARAVRLENVIPLALYSLDYPKAPLLLADFRSPWKPGVREAARRTVEEVPSTILGVATLTNWQVRGAQAAWNFIRGRRGAATHRAARLRAAAAARQAVSHAGDLRPEMRAELQERLGAVAPSATERHEALLAAAASPEGLARRIEKDRGRELAQLLHPHRARLLNVPTVATLGLYRYRVRPTPDRLEVLDRERRLARAARVIEEALAASSRLEVDSDLNRIQHAARDLATVSPHNASARERAERLLARVAEQFEDLLADQELLALLNGLDGAVQEPGGVPSGGGRY
jgi:hypothetical protein